MTATIPCKVQGVSECPYIKTCIARLNDRTVTGCGMAQYVNGLIKYDEIGVQHTVRAESEDDKHDTRNRFD